MTDITTVNVSIVGDEGVGRRSYITRIATNEFAPIRNSASVVFTNQTEKWKFLLTTKNITPQAAIVMFDLTRMDTLISCKFYIDGLRKKFKHIPIVLVGNKSDLAGFNTDGSDNHFISYIHHIIQSFNCYYYSISTKSNYNYDLPLQYCARILANNHKLTFD